MKYPSGIALYSTLQQCLSGVQCGLCDQACKDENSNMKCVAGEACDLAAPTPETCKCRPFDGGVDASTNVPASGGDGGSCSANPTCALESASDVNAALSKNITGPTVRHNVSRGQTLNLCHYDTDPAVTTDVDPVDIAYGFPVTMADFETGRATIMGPTTTLLNLGDAAFWSEPQGKTYGVHSVVVLAGCVQLQVVASAPVDQLVAFAKQILMKL
jgi:hypothetical protein